MNARASRSAVMVASVPVETRRTDSATGTRYRTASARSTSAMVGAPKLNPAGGRLLDGVPTSRVRVAEQGGTPGADEVDVRARRRRR